MNWKNLLESVSASVNDDLRLRHEYLLAENRIMRQQITGRVQASAHAGPANLHAMLARLGSSYATMDALRRATITSERTGQDGTWDNGVTGCAR